MNPSTPADVQADVRLAAWMAHSYDAAAENYNAVFGCAQQVKYRAMLAMPEIQSRLSHRVLDLGCGTGLLREFVGTIGLTADQLAGWVGLDCSPKMLAQARAKGMDVYCGDMNALPFADDSFDLVLAFTSFALLCGREAGEVAEALRVLRPDGLLVATVLAPARDRFLSALQTDGINILREIPCGQDIGWVISRSNFSQHSGR